MEDGALPSLAVLETAPPGSPPPPPDPNLDDAKAAVPLNPTSSEGSDTPLVLSSENWDVTSVSPLGALQMLIEALETLAEATGDVPPTPPVSRPTTPKKLEGTDSPRRVSSNSRLTAGVGDLPSFPIGSPEACSSEPITVEIGAHAEDIAVQHAAIARRFFSRTAPPFTLREYLTRLQHFCPHSSGVYLAAASYIQQLCVTDLMVPATNRTIHRLSLAAIRVAAKTLEDNKWSQDRMVAVGGVSHKQLLKLEVTLCYLLDFDLYVDGTIMARKMFMLQQAARHGAGATGKIGGAFRLRLPSRQAKATVS